MTTERAWIGRAVAIAAVVGAIGLGVFALERLDRRPRTNDGFLYADTAAIAPDVSGRIVKLNVRDNQRVHKGDALLEIDREPFELRAKQAHAQVEALRAQIDLTTRQIASQTSGADAAETQVRRASAQAALATDTRKRLEPLLGKGYVTEQQLDEARTSERSAEAALAAAVQQATQARQAIADTLSLSAQLNGAEAAAALAEWDLSKATVTAPFDGLVVGLEIAEGEYAAMGHPLFTMVATDRWYAVGDFRETELSQIRVGDRATVWMMADTGRPLRGRVDSVGWGVKPMNTGAPGLPNVERSLSWVIVAQRFPVRILLDDPPPDTMRIGATVSVLVTHDAAP
ncbi:MAG TPA: multidrug transporter subunit MdtN [Candidatus Binatia bacterium]|nr:multidrug transporter subunit MdtN [Candidatus Binatia bacterium]